MLWSTLLILTTICLFMLPLLPAIFELMRPTDITPLRVVQAYDNNPFHFANGFRNYVHKQFSISHVKELRDAPKRSGVLPDGTDYKLLSATDASMSDIESGYEHEHVYLSADSITLPSNAVFNSEIYSANAITTGDNSRLRAALADGAMNIGQNNIVLRWAHSNGDMHVGADSIIYGRITSDQTITLAEGCLFERLHAKKIVIVKEVPSAVNAAAIQHTVLEELPGVRNKSGRRNLLEGDLDFPAYHVFDGDIIAGTTAVIDDYAHIKGSVKSNAMNDVAYYLEKTGVTNTDDKSIARCDLGHYVRIDGAVVSTHDLYIGEHCRIGGPVVAENMLVIRTGTIIGTPEQPCTVTAAYIIIEPGCVIYGTLWAGKQGQVVNPQATHLADGEQAA